MNWSDYFYYDESSSSCLRWKVEIRTGAGYKKVQCPKDSPAGSLNVTVGEGYYFVGLHGKQYLAHRIVWELHHGEPPDDLVIDHKDGQSRINKIENLRLVPREINQRNMKMYSTNTSGVTGVSFRESSQSWTAHIYDERGIKTAVSFSIGKHGTQAFDKAVAWREAMLSQVNNRGAGYSDRHGLE